MPEAKDRFLIIRKLGYAINYSKGRRIYREDAIQVTFANSGVWRKLFWRFYWKVSDKGYST